MSPEEEKQRLRYLQLKSKAGSISEEVQPSGVSASEDPRAADLGNLAATAGGYIKTAVPIAGSYIDEARAGVGAGLDKLLEGGDLKQLYAQNKNYFDRYMKDRSGYETAGKVAGVPSAFILGSLLPGGAGKTRLLRMLQNTGIGAALGGLVNPEEGQTRGENAIKGGAFSGALAGIGEGVGAAGQAAKKYAFPWMAQKIGGINKGAVKALFGNTSEIRNTTTDTMMDQMQSTGKSILGQAAENQRQFGKQLGVDLGAATAAGKVLSPEKVQEIKQALQGANLPAKLQEQLAGFASKETLTPVEANELYSMLKPWSNIEAQPNAGESYTAVEGAARAARGKLAEALNEFSSARKPWGQLEEAEQVLRPTFGGRLNVAENMLSNNLGKGTELALKTVDPQLVPIVNSMQDKAKAVDLFSRVAGESLNGGPGGKIPLIGNNPASILERGVIKDPGVWAKIADKLADMQGQGWGKAMSAIPAMYPTYNKLTGE